MRRQDSWRWALKVDGVDIGVARTKDGAAVESDMGRVRPGGMAPEEILGGPATRTNSTLEFAYSERLHDLSAWLESRAGIGLVVLSGQPLDNDKNPKGRVRTLTGMLENVNAPEYDADSGDPGILEVEVALNERAT